MIIVDRALERRAERGEPIRVGMVGAGFMGRGIAAQITHATPGMDLVAICNRSLEGAERAYREAGVPCVAVDDANALDDAIAVGRAAITQDPTALTRSERLDAIVEVTGTIEHAAQVVLDAIDHGKHVVLMNAELDGTLGPYLRVLADRAGVVLSACDGDQPGVQGNLYRFVRGIGIEPLVCGNIKGLHDPHRNPTTQEEFARRWGQSPTMVTSFADGTKISFEQAIVANAFGLTVARRGMGGAEVEGHVDDATGLYDVHELRELGGVVDYLVGARPGPGVFVYGTVEDASQRHYLDLYKLGRGPLYSFYVPYHLCHFEVPASIARAVDFDDAVLAAGPPRVEVVATAKTDLEAGTVLDGLGGYHSYGQAERADITATERLLPMGVAEGARLRRSVVADEVLTVDDVELPPDRLHDELRERQAAHFDLAGSAGSA